MDKVFLIITLFCLFGCTPKVSNNVVNPAPANQSAAENVQTNEQMHHPANDKVSLANKERLLSSIQGRRQKEYTFYDGEGYEVIAYESDKEFNAKDIESLKKKFKISKDDPGKKSDWLSVDNLYFETSEMEDDLNFAKSVYIYRNSKNMLSVIELSTSLKKVNSLEKDWVQLIANDKIPDDRFPPLKVDSIYFVDHFIPLATACQWQDVRSVQCSSAGQMDWSVFSGDTRAREYLDQRLIAGKKNLDTKLITQEEVKVIFNGVKTLAERQTLKAGFAISKLTGNDYLTVFYILTKLEDDYVVAILSQYDKKIDSPTLSPLLAEVMRLE